MQRRILCAWLLTAWLSPAAFADDADPTLAPTVVEADRIPDERTMSNEEAQEELDRSPGGVDLRTEKQIRRTRAVDLKDGLDFVPGVIVQPRGFGEEPRLLIRGAALRNNFHTRGVNVLIDGFPFQNADGFSDVESFELLALRRIEVYKGPHALRYGGGALGGALNLVTNVGEDAPMIDARSELGSWGSSKNYLGGAYVAGPWDVFAAGSRTASEGWRDFSANHRERAYASLGRRLEEGGSLRLDLNYIHNKARLPGSLTLEQFHEDPRQADPEYVRQDAARDYDYARGALTWRQPLGENVVVEWGNQFNYQDLYHPLPFGIIDNETYNATSELRATALSALWGYDQRTTMGVQLAGMRQPQTIWNNDGGHRDGRQSGVIGKAANVALYGEHDFAVTDALHVIGGVRAQASWRAADDRDPVPTGNESMWFGAAMPSLGATYQVVPELQLFANVSRGYEPPLLLEQTSVGNPQPFEDLKAQKAWQFELGARGGVGDVAHYELSVYDWELWDEIRNVNLVPFPGAFFTLPGYTNIDRSRHFGVELGGDLRLLQGLAGAVGLPGEDALRLQAAYTFSYFRYVDDAEFGYNELPGAPPNYLRAGLRYEHASGFWIEPGVESSLEDYWADSANTQRAAKYTIYDLRVGFDHEATGASVFFGATNLTNRKYVSAVIVDVAGTDPAYIDSGTARSFYGGLSWSWK